MEGNYFYNNNQLKQRDKWSDKQVQGTVVYEVIRIINGVPLFFDDHFNRLVNSCKLIGFEYKFNKELLLSRIIELAKINSFKIGNIFYKLIFNQDGVEDLLYFIPHSYPTISQYNEGVEVGILEAERNNPEAKVEQQVRDRANQLLKNGDLYEVLLIDRDGFITEGSKSNLVFVKNGILYTCQLNKVLTGITLKKVVEIAEKENIPIVFEAVHRSQLSSFDALFITGTSPKLLPVAKVGEVSFDVQNKTIRNLMKCYDDLIEQEITNKLK